MMPIVDAAEGFMNGVVKPILNKFVPDAQQRVEAEQFAARQLQELNLAQIEINKIEAASSNLFVSGWRPFIGWVCGGSFAYALVGNDILNWILQVIAAYTARPVPVIPEPDTTIVLEILFALLGFGGFRTYEKIRGVVK